MHAWNFYLHSHLSKAPFMYSTIIAEIFLPRCFWCNHGGVRYHYPFMALNALLVFDADFSQKIIS